MSGTRTAETRGKTERSNVDSGTMRTASEGAGNTRRGLTNPTVKESNMATDIMPRPHIDWTMAQRVDRWMRRSVTPDGDCWIWTGSRTRNGYGQLGIHGARYMAHRAFYMYFVGEIPEGLDLDHLCRNRACVNPWHLDPVTRSVNLLRGDTERTHFSSRVACPQGHLYDEANTAIRRGRRCCRECERARARRQREAKAARA